MEQDNVEQLIEQMPRCELREKMEAYDNLHWATWRPWKRVRIARHAITSLIEGFTDLWNEHTRFFQSIDARLSANLRKVQPGENDKPVYVDQAGAAMMATEGYAFLQTLERTYASAISPLPDDPRTPADRIATAIKVSRQQIELLARELQADQSSLAGMRIQVESYKNFIQVMGRPEHMEGFLRECFPADLGTQRANGLNIGQIIELLLLELKTLRQKKGAAA